MIDDEHETTAERNDGVKKRRRKGGWMDGGRQVSGNVIATRSIRSRSEIGARDDKYWSDESGGAEMWADRNAGGRTEKSSSGTDPDSSSPPHRAQGVCDTKRLHTAVTSVNWKTDSLAIFIDEIKLCLLTRLVCRIFFKLTFQQVLNWWTCHQTCSWRTFSNSSRKN